MSGEEDSDHISSEVHLVVFISLCLLLGGLFRTIKQKFHFVYTPCLMVLGICISVWMEHSFIQEGYQTFNKADKHGLLVMFLPILLFKPALDANYHYFIHIFYQIFILVVPVFLLCTFISAVVFKLIIAESDISWSGALTLGVLVSITDPVETITVLEDQGASHEFLTLIELESIANDGTGFMLFKFFTGMARKEDPADPDFNYIFTNIFAAAIGGILMGVVFKKICEF
jgi:NhaP-type Na+/H+ or K+/H+ antiporter